MKWALAAAVLAFVGRQFYRDLKDLDRLHFRWPWVLLAAGLYLLSQGTWALFWRHVLTTLGHRPGWYHPFRAWFIGQLGKYIPGKAWALLMRAELIRPAGVPMGLAIFTAFYEVLTTMATGALLACAVFLVFPPDLPGLDWHPVYTGLLLLALLGAPLLPGVFNFLLARLARKFPERIGRDLPPLPTFTLLRGILLTGCGWALLGVHLWAMLTAILPESPVLDLETWARFSGANALAYVAGFMAIFLPSGVGVREYVLLALLALPGQEPLFAAGVLLLRLVCTVAELGLAGMFFLFKGPGSRERADTRAEGGAPSVPA